MNSIEVEIKIYNRINRTGGNHYNFYYFSIDEYIGLLNSLTDI